MEGVSVVAIAYASCSDKMTQTFTTFLLDFLGTPAILIGMMTALGLLLQKTPMGDVVKGAIKATLGFVVLQCGGQILCSSLENSRETNWPCHFFSSIVSNA